MKLRWSRRALKDVAQLRDYIALDSPFYAQQFIMRLIIRIENLPGFPESGRHVPETEREDIREIIYQGYRVIYQLRPTQQEVVIISVIHSSRDLTNTKNQVWDKPVQ